MNQQTVREYLGYRKLSTLLLRSLPYGLRPRPKVRITRDLAPESPLISVIIPTFNRSNVLRLAIHSVLWQTEENFELLVMGDGCTDDSESVVHSFGDARIRWHNLAVNSGHQSTPVNAGVALSRGRYITFLGHDDIWHPEHLRSMLSKIVSTGADLVSSLTEMIGPKETNFRLVRGNYPAGGFRAGYCLACSGLMYRREVHERVGGWRDYRTVWRNPDCEFQHQALLQGFRFVSTRELTVYKFNSTLRKNCYVDKPCDDQAEYVARIESERWFLLREMLRIARVHLLRLPMVRTAIPAPPSPETPGWNVTQYRKLRGLESQDFDQKVEDQI